MQMQQSWHDIASFFQSLNFDHSEYAAAILGIAAVADSVAKTPLHLALHGWTSMHDLCIQQTDVAPYSGPYLRLSPLRSGLVEFRYVDTLVENKQWVRTVSPEQAIERFTSFLEQLAGPRECTLRTDSISACRGAPAIARQSVTERTGERHESYF